MNYVKKNAATWFNIWKNYSVSCGEIISISVENMDLLLLMICHENSLTDSLYPILCITLKSGLKQAMEMLKLVGIKGSVLKNGKNRKEPLRVRKTDVGGHLY